MARKKKTVIVTAVLVLIFLVSVGLGVAKQVSERVSPSVLATYAKANHAYDEGIALLPLNAVKGRERLSQAKEFLDSIATQIPERSREAKDVADLTAKVDAALTDAMHVVRGTPAVFYDMGLLRKDSRISAITMDAGMLGILDAPGRSLARVDIASKNATVVAGGDKFTGSRLAASHGTSLYVLTDVGVHKIDTSDNNKVTPLVVKKDEQWGSIGAFVSFGGNLYLLDTAKSRIWKYIATEDGFSDMREYLNADTLPDLRTATSLAIDGSVWIGTTDGKILKFVQGKQDNFVAQGLDAAFGSDLVVYTDDQSNNLYVLDRLGKRVVVLDKDGLYIAQYAWSESLPITTLVVSEKAGKILLVGADKLYSVDLR